MNISESTGFATLIVTIITSVFFPFILRPAINYQVDEEAPYDGAVNRYNIDILNEGLGTAHNVIISLKSSSGKVISFDSEPYLSTAYTSDDSTGSNDTVFAKIEVLPPSGSVKIHAEVEGPLEKVSDLKYVYVSSDEAFGLKTGMRNWIVIGWALFLILAVIAESILWIRFFYPRGAKDGRKGVGARFVSWYKKMQLKYSTTDR